MKLFSSTINTLERALNYSSQKQKVTSENIANVDTPNYKAKNVSFKNTLSNVLSESISTNRTDSRHFEFHVNNESSSFVVQKDNASYNQNGNSVDVDKEMADLATNQIYYNALVERLNGKFNSLQIVIKGGK
jgi:flagellar basal-body rod protein FlgB